MGWSLVDAIKKSNFWTTFFVIMDNKYTVGWWSYLAHFKCLSNEFWLRVGQLYCKQSQMPNFHQVLCRFWKGSGGVDEHSVTSFSYTTYYLLSNILPGICLMPLMFAKKIHSVSVVVWVWFGFRPWNLTLTNNVKPFEIRSKVLKWNMWWFIIM